MSFDINTIIVPFFFTAQNLLLSLPGPSIGPVQCYVGLLYF